MDLFFTQSLFGNKEETSRSLQPKWLIVDMFCRFPMNLKTKMKSSCDLSKNLALAKQDALFKVAFLQLSWHWQYTKR